MTFLRYYLRFENPEISAKFVQELSILTERTTTMGIEELLLDQAKKEGKLEGKKEGKEEGKLEEAKDIARAMKNEGIPLVQVTKFTRLSVEEIEKL